jgi:hypothetical protein
LRKAMGGQGYFEKAYYGSGLDYGYEFVLGTP